MAVIDSRLHTFELVDGYNKSADTEDLSRIGKEIVRFSERRFLWMRFALPLESFFQQDSKPRRGRQLALQGLVSLFIYDSFILCDYCTNPARLLYAFVVRFCLFTPFTLVLIWLTARPSFAKYQEVAAALVCYMASVSMVSFYLGSPESIVQVEGGFVLTLMALNTVLRVELITAMVTSSLCCITTILLLYADTRLPTFPKFSVAQSMVAATLLSCYANYALTREHRLSWLQQRRSRIQSRMLEETNRELVSLSSTDRLTGLANRKAYEETFRMLWADAISKRLPLSAVMVDVDHFKRINDSFGHPYGDRVLQRVATLLQQALREKEDFVARYGGEEFVVLLPNSDTATAMRVAERIRTLVQVAGSPSVTRGDASPISGPLWATVSCGVATVLPSRGMDGQVLIEVADAAMYRAKQNGRNQVCCSPVQYPPVNLAPVEEPAQLQLSSRNQKSA